MNCIHFVCLLLCSLSLVFAASPLEVQALVDLYNDCNGPNWSNNDNWSPNPSTDPCDDFQPWFGISCDGNNPPYINIVKLPKNNLNGTIPASIVNLGSLTILDLSNNDLSGPIPGEIYSMTTLVQLQLQLNNFSGTISPSIGNLQSLFIYSFGQNSLTGSIPTTAYTIASMVQFDLTSNYLTGTIDPSIVNMQKLQIFLVGSNKLTGTIPATIGNITTLSRLQLTTNAMTGTIPDSLCKLNSLTGLWLDNFKVNGGGLTGTIPTCLGDLTNLNYLFLGGNKLTGGVPSDLFRLSNLLQIFVGDNQLGGTIPNNIGSLGSTISAIDLSQSLITGTIPESIGNLTGLTYLNLATNQITGTIPNSINNLTNLQQLELQATYQSPNTLTGTIPEGIFGFQQLSVLLLANNKFSGSLPSTFGLSNLEQFDVTSAGLGGQLPQGLFANSKLQNLYLGNNKFEGSLNLIEALPQLQRLTLNNNQFSGFVPSIFQGTSFGNPAHTVLQNNPFLCPLPSWAAKDTGASCTNWHIAELNPPYGDTISNTLITVNGTNFRNIYGITCNFGDESSPATFISGEALTCYARPTQNTSRVLNFTLSYQGNPFGLDGTATFVYLGIPQINSITPNSGREQGYVNVTIVGANFYHYEALDLVYCLFGETFVPATYINSTHVTCTTPPNSPGDVRISVSIDGKLTTGSLDVSFTYFEYCDGLPEACLGNGVCNTTTSPPKCVCNTNFVGDICGECELQFYGSQCLACPDCGSNGTCNATITGNGLCICEPGFYGKLCAQCPACVNGKCSDGERGSGKCACNSLWGGKLCDSRWKLYVIIILPSVAVIAIVIVVLWRFRRSRREYKPLPSG